MLSGNTGSDGDTLVRTSARGEARGEMATQDSHPAEVKADVDRVEGDESADEEPFAQGVASELEEVGWQLAGRRSRAR